jgi:tRNA-modifying protein YgfZ
MFASFLDDLAAIRVTGADRSRFLQGQLTQDLGRLNSAVWLRAALLTSQGRVLALPRLIERDEATLLLLPAGLAASVIEHLKRYVLRAKVALALDGDATAIACLVPATARELDAHVGVLAPGAHVRLAGGESVLGESGYALVLAPRPQLTAFVGSLRAELLPAAAERVAIEHGEPAVVAATSAAWIPQMLNLDRLDAISFSKGCYTGQEIVARTQHLGRIKRRMLRYRALEVATAAPIAGAALLHQGNKVAEVVRACAAPGGAELLAVVNLDAAEETLLDAGGAAFQRQPLPYALE